MAFLKTLTKYVLKLSLKPFFMGLAGFIVFVSVEWLYQISDYIIRNRVGFSKLLVFIMYNIPYFVVLGIPVGVLFAIFWVISDLYSNREITALLVHGVSSKKLVTPFLILSIVLSFFSLSLADYIVPKANYKSSQILNQYILQSPESVIKTNMLVELERDLYFYVKEYDEEKGELYDVVLFRNEEGNEQILASKKVIKRPDGWYLLDGNMYIMELETGFMSIEMQFKEMKLDVAGEIEDMLRSSRTIRDKTSQELRTQLKTYEKLGVNTASLVVELNQRYANALGSLVIVLIGIPVSLLFGFTSRSWSVIITFLIIVLYQGSGAWLSGMGKEGLMDPLLATWLPNIVFAIVGIILYIMIDTPIAYKIRELLSKLLIIVVLGFLLVGTSLQASEVKMSSLTAIFYDDHIVLKDGIQILWDKYQVECDTATATLRDGKVKTLEADGNVVFRFDDQKFISKYLSYEFESERSLVLNAKTTYDYSYQNKKVPIYVYGANIEYDSRSENAEFSDSYITTCNLEEPHYTVLSSKIYVIENKYIISENAFLTVSNVPLFPYPLFITGLEGTAPYTFSVVFGSTLSVSQTFSFSVNNWDLTLALSTDGISVDAKDKNKNKISYSEKNSTFEFSILPFTYRYNYSRNNLYFKYNGLIYLESNYSNDNNFSHKIGLNYQSPDSKLYLRPYFMYDGALTDSILYLNGGLRNLSFVLFPDNTLSMNSVDIIMRTQTDGYLTKLERSWINYYQANYNTSLTNNALNYKLNIQGSKYENSQNQVMTYTYQVPWKFSSGPFGLNFQYLFNVRDVLNIANEVRKESISMTDTYKLEGKYTVGPFSISINWDQVYPFVDEPISTNSNLITLNAGVSTGALSIATKRGWDLLKNQQTPDTYTLKFTNDVGILNFTGSLSTTYDNIQNKLGNESIAFALNLKPIQLSYTLNFTIKPGTETDLFVHNIKYSNFTASVYQSKDFIKNLIASGYFYTFDYKNTITANFTKSTKDAIPNWRLVYTLERKNEKYSLSYNTDGNKRYSFSTELKNIDPNTNLSITYDPEKQLFTNLALSLDKSLHCWMFSLGAEFSYKTDANFLESLDKIYFKFRLTDMPDKFFYFDPKSGRFEISGM
ncbi:MAG: LptF/LptG family permease [Fervidobacterium sp.]